MFVTQKMSGGGWREGRGRGDTGENSVFLKDKVSDKRPT